jgi:hypothetical protein
MNDKPATPQGDNDAHNNAAHPDNNATSEVKIPPSHPCYSITYKSKRDKWDIAKLVAEFIGLGFLIAYTIYTAGIYCANKKAADAAHDTLGEIQKQTLLIRQQLIGTQAAIIRPTRDPAIWIYAREVQMQWNVANRGHVISKKVTLSVVAKYIDISTGKTLAEKKLSHDFLGDFPPTERPEDEQIFLYPILDQPSDTFNLWTDGKLGIAFAGNIVYDNGFKESVTYPLCYYSFAYRSNRPAPNDIVPNGLSCDDGKTFETAFEIADKNRRVQTHQDGK